MPWQRSRAVCNGIRPDALTLEALIASRKAVRRKKDLEQLVELEAIQALRKRKARG